MSTFITRRPEELTENVFEAIGKQWMLVTAGKGDDCNTMTASWGGLGVLWNKPSAFVFVRPSRHTYGFTEREDTFSLCFFDESYRAMLQMCGTKSGRDVDKIREAGLTLRQAADTPYFEEAQLVLVCRKRYAQDMDPACFTDPTVEAHYGGTDYHRVYVGEILEVLQKDESH